MILLPVILAGLVGTAAVVKHKRDKAASDPKLQAERQVIYDTALNTVKDPDKLRKLADSFDEAGLIAEAEMLRKRAALQELPADVKEARREAFRQGMASTDVVKIHTLADAFESQGATGAAENLRKYAAGLTAATVTAEEAKQ